MENTNKESWNLHAARFYANKKLMRKGLHLDIYMLNL